MKNLIIVTGGAGFVGSNLIKSLLKETNKKIKDQKAIYKYSDYQKSERDFAFVIDKNFKVQDLVNIISDIDKNLIRSVKVFDEL